MKKHSTVSVYFRPRRNTIVVIACNGNGGGGGLRRVVGRAGDGVVTVNAGWGRRWLLDALGRHWATLRAGAGVVVGRGWG